MKIHFKWISNFFSGFLFCFKEWRHSSYQYLASYWGEFNIRVNSISPGGIESGQNENFVNNYSSKISLKRMATTKDIIEAAIFLSSDASSYITGQNILVNGGFTL